MNISGHEEFHTAAHTRPEKFVAVDAGKPVTLVGRHCVKSRLRRSCGLGFRRDSSILGRVEGTIYILISFEGYLLFLESLTKNQLSSVNKGLSVVTGQGLFVLTSSSVSKAERSI